MNKLNNYSINQLQYFFIDNFMNKKNKKVFRNIN